MKYDLIKRKENKPLNLAEQERELVANLSEISIKTDKKTTDSAPTVTTIATPILTPSKTIENSFKQPVVNVINKLKKSGTTRNQQISKKPKQILKIKLKSNFNSTLPVVQMLSKSDPKLVVLNEKSKEIKNKGIEFKSDIGKPISLSIPPPLTAQQSTNEIQINSNQSNSANLEEKEKEEEEEASLIIFRPSTEAKAIKPKSPEKFENESVYYSEQEDPYEDKAAEEDDDEGKLLIVDENNNDEEERLNQVAESDELKSKNSVKVETKKCENSIELPLDLRILKKSASPIE